jgi:hypothetical protein
MTKTMLVRVTAARRVDPQEALYNIADWKTYKLLQLMSVVTNSSTMLTAIPEVDFDLGMECVIYLQSYFFATDSDIT